MERDLILQGIARVTALSLPLLIVLGIRSFVGVESQVQYFSVLSDVVVLAALLKVGVDSYILSCRIDGKKTFVDSSWWFVWLCVNLALIFISAWLFLKHGNWITPLAVVAVLNSLMVAEANRLREKYLQFYLLKAPAAYVISLVLVYLTGYYILIDFVLFLVLLGVFVRSVTSLKVCNDGLDFHSLLLGALVSFFVVVFSWKEALVSRWLFQSEALPELVFFTRLLLIITFPFMLRNARVPVLLRSEGKNLTLQGLRDVANLGRVHSIVWAVMSCMLIGAYTVYFEAINVLGAVLIALSGVVLVLVGNLGACLIYLRQYMLVVIVYVFSIIVFLVGILIFNMFRWSVFTSISASTLLSQIFFAIVLVILFKKVGNTQLHEQEGVGA